MEKIASVKKKKSKKWILPVILIVLVSLSGISLFNQSQTYRVQITLPDGKVLMAEVADSMEERLLGFFMAGSLTPDLAVLFIYEEAGNQKIWSRNIQMPVDLVWLDANRKVIQVDSNVLPCLKEPCPDYQSSEPAMFLLQVISGAAREHDLEKGASIKMRKPQSEAS